MSICFACCFRRIFDPMTCHLAYYEVQWACGWTDIGFRGNTLSEAVCIVSIHNKNVFLDMCAAGVIRKISSKRLTNLQRRNGTRGLF